MGSWPEGTGQDSPYISYWWECVCVCALIFFPPYMTQAEGNGDASFWAISVLLHWPLGKLIFAGVSRSSFNCFTSLISSSLTTNSSPLFLLPPLFLTSSQAVRPWGCQGRNKVTGWWARHPMSDHMDWCCARHHSRWLTQQGSSHNTRTYCRPGLFFILFPHPPKHPHNLHLISVYFYHSNLPDVLCSSICLFVSSQSLHSETCTCCFFLHGVEVKAVIILSQMVDFLLPAELWHAPTIVLEFLWFCRNL